MAYVIPTAADLKARYPAFAAVADATVDIHIADAATNGVDTSWIEADYSAAICALAAHTMALLGIGEATEAESYARQGVTALRTGNFSASFSDKRVAAASGGGYDATPYGQAYKRLLRKSKGGPQVATGGVYPDGWGPVAQQNDGQLLP